MKISILRGKDKSKAASGDHKVPLTEMKGVPVRVTDFQAATRSHGAEAVVILTRGRIRSFVASAGELKLYLSPRAEFRCLEPDPPEERLAEEPLTLCAACRDGWHVMCENVGHEDDWCECKHASHPFATSGGQS